MTKNRKPLLLLAIALIAITALALWQTGYWARSFVMSDIRDRSGNFLNLVVENLRGELAKFQYQPRLLAHDPTLERALSNDASAEDVARANEVLIRSNDVSGASATFLMDSSGRTVAASDGQAVSSFVGQNFSYRPYFQQAMQGSLGRDFALDPKTGERSYYFAHPVRNGSRVVGAVAIKIPIDLLEPTWSSSDHKILVLDSDGIVFLSSHPDWRFRSLGTLPQKIRNRLILSRTYGTMSIAPLPITGEPGGEQISVKNTPWGRSTPPRSDPATTYLVQNRSMNEVGWRVLILSDMRDVGQQVNIWSAIVAFMMASIVLFAANIYQRRRRFAERLALQESAKEELEAQVAERTADLTEANTQLRNEISERHKTEIQLRQTQTELVQATKLAALGQLSAGLSHELNQPLAAIRSYSDNAKTYLERDQVEPARKNLSGISELTDRMGRIIKNLRTYAREESVASRAVSVNRAIEEACALLQARIKSEHVTVDIILPDRDIAVMGGAVRLQQVMVNLMSNALDAMRETETKRLHISLELTDRTVDINIRDSGPGLREEDVDKLFDPFFSTKEVGEGMGLGLSITYGIIRQFGGEISATNHASGGALFKVSLQRADSEEGAAA